MFEDCNPLTNGELNFYNRIKPNISIIFDVGCRNDSLFLDFPGEVHYFDPVDEFVDQLEQQPRQNIVAVFNRFGLSNRNGKLQYYPGWQSFYTRMTTCGRHIFWYNSSTKLQADQIAVQVRKGSEYMAEKGVGKIDFMKIDTEGSEYDVLLGFGNRLRDIGIIQFEYGECNIDSKVKLSDITKLLTKHGFTQFGYLDSNGSLKSLDVTGEIVDNFRFCNIVAARDGLNV